MIKTKYVIREVALKEIPKVMEINRKCLPENYTQSFFLQHYKKFPKAFLVADVNNEVVGYVMCRVEYGISNFRFAFVKKGHIISIAVLPEYRRVGIGYNLMIKSMEALKNYGATEVYLEVRVSNYPAIRLYEKLNYKIVNKIIGYYADGEDAYVMAREL
ncbi:MAG: ribosomal protein S18-alanine N-acetyltransferase [Candidatus Methanomethylicia archaeon]|nr:ribosomal protein S18-alanine N-acetyltransferase [Candidatus Methanomethylicia archaeon]MDW7988526.1 ribosomal protein S18-alanine N-acetyltransferase [Nitrososphaerota archaeon]